MPWFAIYQSNNGRLESIGELEAMPVLAGMVALQLASKPDLQRQMWDETARTFVARPDKVLIDRLVDIQSNPNFQDFMDAYNTLSAANKTKLRTALVRLLGRHRYRAVNESVELP